MQRTLKLPLSDNFNVPVFELYGYARTYCLLDTGASMAVWCSGVDALHDVFENAVSAGSQALLSGFGGSGEFADVYKIPLLQIRDTLTCIDFRNVYVAVLARIRFGFDLILPAVMFSKTDYKINNCCDVRSLQIYSDRNVFLSITRMRKFTVKEAELLRSELGLEVPSNMETVDSVVCLPQGSGLPAKEMNAF